MSAAIVVDTSAIVAILNKEPEAGRYLQVLDSSHTIIGCATILEVRIWCLRYLDKRNEPWFGGWLDDPNTQVVAFDRQLEDFAASAYDRFGKGRHPAALNFGDAMTYAVARRYDAPLLFKGGDFGKADLRVHEASVS